MAKLSLGLQLGYWGAQPNPNFVSLAQEAENLGFDSVWVAESWGNDCFTPLAWIGAQTSKIRLGTAVAQLSARTPTACAMATLALDHLSGGRMIRIKITCVDVIDRAKIIHVGNKNGAF